MEQIEVVMIRRDAVKVELDPEFFNEKWFEEFQQYFYDYDTLEELAEYIVFNIVENNARFIEGVGIPLDDGEVPYWAKHSESYTETDVNTHVNVKYNNYATEAEFE